MPQPRVYVFITGLRVRRVWHTSVFWWHAIRSMSQARRAAGNISAGARTIGGVHHTLSVWTDREAMLTYLSTGAHLEAMRLFPKIATGKTLGYHTNNVPDWPKVHALWSEKGVAV